ncbi:hypothetical protein LF1_39130 [Rubripirellula obstinata]|uniref:Uncharacterized protein n=1 Tax=Rubripirellula obstinata TaxID=406547 RepID=A0A5B1CLF4_9BACT|nr:hypothetical protein LF1_39130 [Rubripirellula obstinata]
MTGCVHQRLENDRRMSPINASMLVPTVGKMSSGKIGSESRQDFWFVELPKLLASFATPLIVPTVLTDLVCFATSSSSPLPDQKSVIKRD